jgi:hypothetical protein
LEITSSGKELNLHAANVVLKCIIRTMKEVQEDLQMILNKGRMVTVVEVRQYASSVLQLEI